MFEVGKYKQIIESKGIAIIDADFNGINKVNIQKFNDFISLMDAFTVKAVFADISLFDEEDINSNLISLDEIEDKYRVVGVETKIEEHNKKINSFRSHIGIENNVELAFSSDGIMYQYTWNNDDLDEVFLDTFYDSLNELFAEEIEKNEDREREARILRREAYKNLLRTHILNDSSFYSCTNQSSRRDYTQRLLGNKELRPPEGVQEYAVFIVVDEIWKEIKGTRKP